MGDAIQAAKAGILEVGDVYCVNKADREGADVTARETSRDVGARARSSRDANRPSGPQPSSRLLRREARASTSFARRSTHIAKRSVTTDYVHDVTTVLVAEIEALAVADFRSRVKDPGAVPVSPSSLTTFSTVDSTPTQRPTPSSTRNKEPSGSLATEPGRGRG